MIEKIAYLDQLAENPGTVFGVRIRSTAEAYGVETPFAQFFRQDSGAVLCKLDDAVVLAAPAAADFEELRSLARAVGASRLICDGALAGALGLPVAAKGDVLRRDGPAGDPGPAPLEENPGPREIYGLLRACAGENFRVPEFEPFYLDLSHRTRHGTAMSVGIRRGGALAACAVCTAKTPGAAVLSAVAVHPDHRRGGLGRAAVFGLLRALPQPAAYVLCGQAGNLPFYRALGFAPCGAFAELRVDDR